MAGNVAPSFSGGSGLLQKVMQIRITNSEILGENQV
jgi:hypothetical protein